MKKIISLSLALILALSLAACGGSGNSGGNSTNPPVTQGGNETPSGGALGNFSKDFIKNNAGSNFIYTYTVTATGTAADGAETRTVIVTDEGHYYKYERPSTSAIGENKSEYWYIKNADGKCDVYYRRSDDTIAKQDDAAPDDWVGNCLSLDFISRVALYENYANYLKKDGSETFAGRDCEKFSLDGKDGKCEYLIDKATGLSMKYKLDHYPNGTDEFSATELTTGGQSLPAYN